MTIRYLLTQNSRKFSAEREVILRPNINIEQGLVNGAMGTITKII